MPTGEITRPSFARASSTRLERAMLQLHRKGVAYWGLTPAGQAHLRAGGEIGGNGMPISLAMQAHEVCTNCPSDQGWPCRTVQILLKAGSLRGEL